MSWITNAGIIKVHNVVHPVHERQATNRAMDSLFVYKCLSVSRSIIWSVAWTIKTGFLFLVASIACRNLGQVHKASDSYLTCPVHS